MPPIMIPVTADMLKSLMGPREETFACQLPIPSESAATFLETISQASKVLNALSTLTNLQSDVRATLETLDSFKDFALEPEKNFKIFSMRWYDLALELETHRAMLPEDLEREVVADYDLLIVNLNKCGRLFAIERFEIEFTGGERELGQLTDRLKDAFVDLGEDRQAELAEKYGWTRGVTTCCDRMGYNPPPGVPLMPVHDPQGVEGAQAENRMMEILSKFVQSMRG